MITSPPSRKHYLPLESNPEVFTQLIQKLGVEKLQFVDVYSLDDLDLLSFVPRPVLALVLVFPTSNAYEKFRVSVDASREEYSGSGDGEDVIWFKQTIGNACGLYAILHSVCNGNARNYISANSSLANILQEITPLAPAERALALEASSELENAHSYAAHQGISEVPASAEASVDFHYVAFILSHKTESVYELDGRRKGPIDRGITVPEGDMLNEAGLALIKEFIAREGGENANFSLMALVES